MQKSQIVVSCAAILAAASISSASLLVDFGPVSQLSDTINFQPTVGGTPDTRYIATSVAAADIGLRSAVPVFGVPGSAVVDGYTVFTHTNLTLSGLTVDGAVEGTGSLTQYLSGGTFTFKTAGGITLLAGTFNATFTDPADSSSFPANFITGGRGTATGSVYFNNITYTSGAVYDALLSIPGATATGDANWSLLLVTPTLAKDSGYLRPFSARVLGQFSTPVIPEPSTLAGLVPAAALLVARRRRA